MLHYNAHEPEVETLRERFPSSHFARAGASQTHSRNYPKIEYEFREHTSFENFPRYFPDARGLNISLNKSSK